MRYSKAGRLLPFSHSDTVSCEHLAERGLRQFVISPHFFYSFRYNVHANILRIILVKYLTYEKSSYYNIDISM